MKVLLLLATMFGLSFSSLASDGSSGCGPGWYVLQENSLVSSSLRATTNGFLFPVTTIGMTIGSSNCTRHKIVLKEKESLHFVSQNYFEFRSDSAKGRGAYLSALAETIGCKKSSEAVFNSSMKKNYKKVFGHKHSQPEKVLEEVYKIILRDSELVQSCSLS
jgi:predicted RNA-binding protein YlxR (DUF448 family)